MVSIRQLNRIGQTLERLKVMNKNVWLIAMITCLVLSLLVVYGEPKQKKEIVAESEVTINIKEAAKVVNEEETMSLSEATSSNSSVTESKVIEITAGSDLLRASKIENQKVNSDISDLQKENMHSMSLAASRGSARAGTLLRVQNEDPAYKGTPIKLSKEDREFLEKLVMAEAGDEEFIGAAIVAQAIRDAMVSDGLTVKEVWKNFVYTKNLKFTPNEDVRVAVNFIFDTGGSAVQHRILYFYAPRMMKSGISKFHESQKFIVEYGGHRVFDRVSK